MIRKGLLTITAVLAFWVLMTLLVDTLYPDRTVWVAYPGGQALYCEGPETDFQKVRTDDPRCLSILNGSHDTIRISR